MNNQIQQIYSIFSQLGPNPLFFAFVTLVNLVNVLLENFISSIEVVITRVRKRAVKSYQCWCPYKLESVVGLSM